MIYLDKTSTYADSTPRVVANNIANQKLVMYNDNVYKNNLPVNDLGLVNKYIPLNYTNISNSVISRVWVSWSTSYNVDLEYSFDSISWTKIPTNYSGWTYTLEPGQTIYFRGDNPTLNCASCQLHISSSNWSSDGEVALAGNILSIISKQNFEEMLIPSGVRFTTLFSYKLGSSYYGNRLVDASRLYLPDNTLSLCYESMFRYCRELRLPPVLRAESISSQCYYSIFYQCPKVEKIYIYADGSSNNLSSAFDTWAYSGLTGPGTVYLNMLYEDEFRSVLNLNDSWEFKPIQKDYSKILVYLDRTAVELDPDKTFAEQGYTQVYSTPGVEYESERDSVNISNELPTGYQNKVVYSSCILTEFLKFTAVGQDSSITRNQNRGTIYYSLDKVNWSKFSSSNNKVDIPDGETVYMYGDNPTSLSYSDRNYYGFFKMTGNIYCDGNIQVLVGIDCPNTIPSADYYYNLFYECSALKSAPRLPATQLTKACYAYMFRGTGITEMPDLPAVNTAESCYQGMFNSCYYITEVKPISANTTPYCYYYMFAYCTGLKDVSIIHIDSTADHCCYGMFYDCEALVVPPKLNATSLVTYCYYLMFSKCYNLVGAPELPEITLAGAYCCTSMFLYCNKLSYVKCLANTTTQNTYLSWLNLVNSTGVFVKKDTSSIAVNAYGIPEGWTVVNASEVAENETFVIIDDLIVKVLKDQTFANLGYSQLYSLDWSYVNPDEISVLAEYPSPGRQYFTAVTLITEEPLYVEAESDIDVRIYKSESSNFGTFYYSYDKATWTTLLKKDSYNSISLPLEEGQRLYFYGENPRGTALPYYSSYSLSSAHRIIATGPFKVGGSITSLISKTCPTQLEEGLSFAYLFSNSTITKAPELPITTLSTSCYLGMFSHCENLVEAPQILPATTLTRNCYNTMFEYCPSITTVPLLLATTLADNCCYFMFRGCTSLQGTVVFPATTLASQCYYGMLEDTNIIPDVRNIDFTDSDTVSSRGLQGLFSGTKVTDSDLDRMLPHDSNGNYCLPVTDLSNSASCYSSMFKNCTSLVTAPKLPATILSNGVYENMFTGCTSLVNAPELPAETAPLQCYYSMFENCTSLVTAPDLPATTLEESTCYYAMFRGCTALVNVPSILPAAELVSGCYKSMFAGCTSLVTAPELPALALVYECYQEMFYNCKSLRYIKAMFISAPGSYSYSLTNWVYNVPYYVGTFVKNKQATWNLSGTGGVPYYWTVQLVDA